ncbi:hypothetical protein [Aquabacterium sp.]|uniref:hypothetical protein n=1 Tax=Aquabacterium sp. TaxID=1872578 RepID=UPI002CA22D16|nr:hypothetical protein [Aquabacterium sp.]HSW04126.1 hypothetical protein [Aquabacterium sp.]
MRYRTCAAGLTLAFASAAALATPSPQGAGELLARHASLQQQLTASSFGRPIVLQSGDSAKNPHGDVYAEIRHPFAGVTSALQPAQAWCDVMLLQTNVKRCVAAGDAASPTLRVSLVRKSSQSVEEAQQVEFRYTVRAASATYLALEMKADSGPVGTSDYSLTLEAVPLDAERTFVHMSYAYANGLPARLATETYLATSGRSKVGFSVTGRDESGQPVYVTGVRGIAERNTMRYYLAIEAVLAASKQPAAQQLERRMDQWFSAVERYPRQLKEMERADYLAMKRRDLQVSTTQR